MTGALGTTSSIRMAGVPSHQLRPSQSSLRPQTSSSSQSPAAQVANLLDSGFSNGVILYCGISDLEQIGKSM